MMRRNALWTRLLNIFRTSLLSNAAFAIIGKTLQRLTPQQSLVAPAPINAFSLDAGEHINAPLLKKTAPSMWHCSFTAICWRWSCVSVQDTIPRHSDLLVYIKMTGLVCKRTVTGH